MQVLKQGKKQLKAGLYQTDFLKFNSKFQAFISLVNLNSSRQLSIWLISNASDAIDKNEVQGSNYLGNTGQ